MKNLLLLIVILFAGQIAFAQSGTTPTPTPAQTDTAKSKIEAGWGDLNYAVPESPAFNILGTSPSNIMKPTSVKDIAVSIGDYVSSNGGTIPKNLAVEFSPLLLSPHVSLEDFKNHPTWYTSALSIGTKQNADKSYAIGIGLRFTLIDHQDLRTSNALSNALITLTDKGTKDFRSVIRQFALARMASDTSTKVKIYENYLDTVSNIYKSAKSAKDIALQQEVKNALAKVFYADSIPAIRNRIKQNLWNKEIMQIGIAGLLNSKDSLLKDVNGYRKYGFWATLGEPLGAKGQALIGINAQLKDTTNKTSESFSLGTRLYYGANDLKGFFEANEVLQSNMSGTFKASIGIETTFFGGMWLDFTLGLSKTGSAAPTFTPGINLFFANGEKKTPGS